ncbi:sugar ABC transporter substrate-binding protein [Methylocystis echinoides]|uniref:Sugar ABC transporter substrate-binding protein n=2 Tax=Methylocystis echinoides TaxID=29468 RepID=A0A9W6GZW7_9HYPH|nr:sugar ABC transporter substrate-binding protein [Methylocystis echinoides]
MALWHIALSCAWMMVSILSATATEASSQYLLGPQDRLTIRVYDLRRNTGEAYPWSALTGEFSVGADGTVSLPLIGQIKANGGTTADLADAIGAALKRAADLAEKPAASVEVLTHRPYYITGAVQQPGKYEYQPGLTVLQAVSTAQGLMRGIDPRVARRDVVISRGELRALSIERVTLMSKQARLEAEISGADAITVGGELKAFAKKVDIDQAIRVEQLLFESHRKSVQAETSAIEQSISAFRNEIAALENKSKALDRQLELSRGELNLVNDLVARGLAISPRKLAAEQSQTAFESSRLDVQVALLRAQQSLTRAERDIIELKGKARREALTESAETRSKLNQNAEKLRTTERLVSDSELDMPGVLGVKNGPVAPQFEITRRSGGNTSSWIAQENSVVEPGDVVRVLLLGDQNTKADDMPTLPSLRHPTDANSPNQDATPSTGAIHKSAEGVGR